MWIRLVWATIIVTTLVLTMASVSAHADKRVALVVGNSDYTHARRLINPGNDAADVAAALTRLGFEVSQARDVTGEAFDKALATFTSRLAGGDVALFYYAGHGLQHDNINYLLPIDARLESEFSIKREAIAAQDVVAQMETGARISLVFLDACRNNPLAERLRQSLAPRGRDASLGRGLARMEPRGRDTLIVFAAGAGQLAEDGKARNSPFTAALLKYLEVPGVEIEEMLKDVSADVEQATEGKQQPERLSRLKSKLRLKSGLATIPSPTLPNPPSPPVQSEAAREWAGLDKANVAQLETFIGRHGASPEAAYARARLAVTARSKVEPVGRTAAARATDSGPLGLRLVSRTRGDGVEIEAVDPGSDAAQKGLKSGDVIFEVQSQQVTTAVEVVSGVERAVEFGRRAVLLHVESAGNKRFVAVQLRKGTTVSEGSPTMPPPSSSATACKGLDEAACKADGSTCGWIVPRKIDPNTGLADKPYCRKVAGIAKKK